MTQYNLAVLRSRLAFFSYKKALAKLQITSKRILLRTSGCVFGKKNTVQQEFDIDDVSGVEIPKGFVFRFWDFFVGMLISFAGFFCVWLVTGIVMFILSEVLSSSYSEIAIISKFIILAITAALFAYSIKICREKRDNSQIKLLLCLGAMGVNATVNMSDIDFDSLSDAVLPVLAVIIAVVDIVWLIYTLISFAHRATLILCIKTNLAANGIELREKHFGLPLRLMGKGSIVYSEVIPAIDSDKCMQEINELIISAKQQSK